MPPRARTNSRTRSSHLTVIGAIVASLEDAVKQVRIGEQLNPKDSLGAFVIADRDVRNDHAAIGEQVRTLQRRHGVVVPDEFFKPLDIVPRLSLISDPDASDASASDEEVDDA